MRTRLPSFKVVHDATKCVRHSGISLGCPLKGREVAHSGPGLHEESVDSGHIVILSVVCRFVFHVERVNQAMGEANGY